MKIKKLIVSTIVMVSLLPFFTGCPIGPCRFEHGIENKVTILPQKDTLQIGDTIKIYTSMPIFYEYNQKNIDNSDEEIDIRFWIDSYKNDTNFYENRTQLDNLEFIVEKGITKDTTIFQDIDGKYREFFYKQNDDKFEIEMEIVVKQTGNYLMQIYSAPNYEQENECEENFSVYYFINLEPEHLLNEHLINNTTLKNSKNSFYAFVVVE